jgi:hypothetical protein
VGLHPMCKALLLLEHSVHHVEFSADHGPWPD